MGYNGEDEELSRLRAESARRKKELEELQREELRRIRELEQQKMHGTGSEYDPEMDSAFISDGPSQSEIQAAARREAQERRAAMERQAEQQQRVQQQAAAKEAAARRAAAERRAEMERQAELERQQRTRRRAYDPDQIVSDEDYEDSYEDDDDEYEAPRRKSRPDNRRPQNKKKKKKKKKKFRVLKTIIVILLVLLLAFGAAIWNITRKFDHIDTEVGKRPESMKHQTINILLIGEDAREGEESQRTDTMIILSINQKKNTVCMMSFMRDMYVDIPGYGGNRINAAYAFGGVDLLDQTIEENFGITIDANMKVNLEGFLESMAAIGSLDMDLTAEEAAYMNENPQMGSNTDITDEVWELSEGTNSLTPSQILGYSRMRYVGNSDWDRTERQRKVISGVISKVKHGHLISGYKVAGKAAPHIGTDMGTLGMSRMALGLLTGGDPESYQIPAENTYYADNINGMAVLVPDIEANKALIQQYISGEYEADTEE